MSGTLRTLALRSLASLAGLALIAACGAKEAPAPATPAPATPSDPAPTAAAPAPEAAAPDPSAVARPPAPGPSIHDLDVMLADGTVRALSDYEGNVLLIVNTATGCGFTPQLGELEALRARFANRGFEILAFPSDDFDQDPGTATESAATMASDYGVTFPVFAKARVKGPDKSPLFARLIGDGPDVSWNFNKFLVDTEGRVIARFDSRAEPLSQTFVDTVERALPRATN